MKNSVRIIQPFAVVMLLTVVGCSGPQVAVKEGDEVGVQFTCRLADGSLAVSSDSRAGLTDGERRSPLFMPREIDDPILLEAGMPAAAAKGKIRPMEEEVLQQLRGAVIGMREGERKTLALVDETQGKESIIKYSRIRRFPKEQRMTRDAFKEQAGTDPVVGAELPNGFELPATVTAVSDTEVTVGFRVEPGTKKETFFGTGTYVDAGDQYELHIEAEKGKLVRTGYLSGRIKAVTEGSVDIDFGSRFAGENLVCDLMVESIAAGPEPVRQPESSQEAQSLTPAEEKKELEWLKGEMTSAMARKKERVAGVAAEPASGETDKAGVPDVVGGGAVAGDLAHVEYTATLEDGTVFYTTSKAVADDPLRKKTAWFMQPPRFGAEAVAVGKPALMPGVGEAVIGMKVGEKKRLDLPADAAFGTPDPGRTQQLPLVRTFPRLLTLTAEQYVQYAGGFPELGKEVSLFPWFPSRVVGVKEQEVQVELLATDGDEKVEPFGTLKVGVSGDQVTLTLQPVVGAIFPVKEGSGIISAADGTTFTVDLNHPLAGKPMVIDLEMTGLTRATELPTSGISWLEEHDAGLATAKSAAKPAVLLLYADWCSYCAKLDAETLPDPRISELRDRFVWVRVNSDKLTEIKQRYGQTGFPMLVLFKPDGTVASTLNGFQEASALRAALQEVL